MDIQLPTKNFTAPDTGVSQHTVFEIILLLVVAGLFYFFIISPKQAEVQTLQTAREGLEKEFSELEQNERDLNQAIATMKSNPSLIANLDEALPLDNKVTKLYIALESLTKDSGMIVGDISVAFKSDQNMAGDIAKLNAKYKTKRSLQKLSTSLDVTGTFDQFQALLKKLEESGRLINISSIDITAAENDQLNFKVNLEAYFYE